MRAKSLNQIINGAKTVTMTANATTPLTSAMELTFEETLSLKVAATFTGVTVVGAITLKLQHSYDGGTSWLDAQSVAVTSSTTFSVSNNANGSDPALWPMVRVVLVSTNASDAAVCSAVWVSRAS